LTFLKYFFRHCIALQSPLCWTMLVLNPGLLQLATFTVHLQSDVLTSTTWLDLIHHSNYRCVLTSKLYTYNPHFCANNMCTTAIVKIGVSFFKPDCCLNLGFTAVYIAEQNFQIVGKARNFFCVCYKIQSWLYAHNRLICSSI
jgi:hypothetical protein